MATIWIYKQYAVGPSRSGNTRHYEIGRRLARQGHEIVVWAAGFHYAEQRGEETKSGTRCTTEEVDDNLTFVWLESVGFENTKWGRVLDFASYSLQALRLSLLRRRGDSLAHIPSPDVVVGCTVPPSGALSGLVSAKLFSAEYVYEVGDIWPETLVQQDIVSGWGPSSVVLRSLDWLCRQNSKAIVTSLTMGGEFYRERGYDGDSIFWIPNGAGDEMFGVLGAEGRSGRTVAIYTGAHSPVVNLDVVIEAAQLIEESGSKAIEWHLVGTGPEKRRLQDKAQRLDLDSVRFSGPVERSSIPHFLERADVGLIHFRDLQVHRRYGLGSKSLSEYLAAGLPVIIGSRCAGNLVERSGGGYTVPPESPAELARAVEQFHELSKGDRERLGRKAREYACDHLDWEVLADKYHRVITEALSFDYA